MLVSILGTWAAVGRDRMRTTRLVKNSGVAMLVAYLVYIHSVVWVYAVWQKVGRVAMLVAYLVHVCPIGVDMCSVMVWLLL